MTHLSDLLAPIESFHAHHSPLGAFASFTLGLIGSPGGFGHALRGPARQNVYVGFRTMDQKDWSLFPFFLPPKSREGTFTGEEATASAPTNMQLLAPSQFRRTLGWASDTWHADEERFVFSLLSPFEKTLDPARMKKSKARLALSPHVNGWIEYDNTRGTQPVELVFGIGEADHVFRPLQDADPKLLGFAIGTRFAYATPLSRDVEPRQGFDILAPKFRDFRGLLVIGGESALVFTVPAGKKKRFPLVFAFYEEGTIGTGIRARYGYTRYFARLEEVVAHGLAERSHYEKLANRRDRELGESKLTDDQKFLLAQATHSYLGNTQLLWNKRGPLWVVNEGEYRMMNTFDLTVDHLFFELTFHPWAIRNVLDLFVERYSYRDRLQIPGGASVPGGISFTHDMGVFSGFTPKGHSSYECDNLTGCFSHMAMEQLLNWVICATTYGSHQRDLKWLRKHRSTLLDCAESLRRRDNPDPTQRDGILKHDSLRCGPKGAEITTYDALDVSLGQARNNLYLAVKTLGAWVLLEHAFGLLKLDVEARHAGASADLLAQTLERKFDTQTGTFPAVFEAGNQSRIIPAVEGLAYPLFLGIQSATDRKGRFRTLLDLLDQHLKNVLRPGICIDSETGAWKMSSTSTNTWFSKIALSQHVIRHVFPEAMTEAARDGDRVHARWQQNPPCGKDAMCDQVRSNSGIPCGSRFYPRGVTTILWLSE